MYQDSMEFEKKITSIISYDIVNNIKEKNNKYESQIKETTRK